MKTHTKDAYCKNKPKWHFLTWGWVELEMLNWDTGVAVGEGVADVVVSERWDCDL